jgi:type IV pilus assembly protein PilE
MAKSKKGTRGFTLIELLIAVTVVAILSAIAIPSYTEYVRRAHLADGQKAMASAALELEQIFADRRAYPVNGSFSASGTPDMSVGYTASNDRRSFTLNSSGTGKMQDYHLAQTSAGARCKCEKCGSNPINALATTATSCPAGSLAW